MSTTEHISQIESQINALRLELIRIIAEINRTIAGGKGAIKGQQYKLLKEQYICKQEELHYLRVMKTELLPLTR
jgi:hypothetical protein